MSGMEPLVIASLAMGGASLGVSTVSSVMGARGQAEQAKTEAELVAQEAVAAEKLSREASERQLATARTQIGASGAGLEGSPLEVLIESTRQAELDALNIRYSGQLRESALKQGAKFARKTIFPTVLGNTLQAGSLATGFLAQNQSGTKKPSTKWKSKYFNGDYVNRFKK